METKFIDPTKNRHVLSSKEVKDNNNCITYKFLQIYRPANKFFTLTYMDIGNLITLKYNYSNVSKEPLLAEKEEKIIRLQKTKNIPTLSSTVKFIFNHWKDNLNWDHAIEELLRHPSLIQIS